MPWSSRRSPSSGRWAPSIGMRPVGVACWPGCCEEHRALHAHLAALPAAQRDAIALRFGAGLTAREIGLVLGKGEEATQKLISRGMARLREVYRDDD